MENCAFVNLAFIGSKYLKTAWTLPLSFYFVAQMNYAKAVFSPLFAKQLILNVCKSEIFSLSVTIDTIGKMCLLSLSLLLSGKKNLLVIPI